MIAHDAATQPSPETVRETGVQPVILPPYAVLIFNDDVNTMDHVVQALLACIPELEAQQAVRVMLEAHNDGKAVATLCPHERAELYRDRLQQQGITATVERA